MVQDISEMKRQYARVYNELPHLDAVKQMGFLGITKEGWAIIVVVGLIAYFLGRSNCRCDSSDNNKRSRNSGGSLGSTLANRAVGKAFDYGLSRILK